nr:hypothetical protein [Herbinix sp.]
DFLDTQTYGELFIVDGKELPQSKKSFIDSKSETNPKPKHRLANTQFRVTDFKHKKLCWKRFGDNFVYVDDEYMFSIYSDLHASPAMFTLKINERKGPNVLYFKQSTSITELMDICETIVNGPEYLSEEKPSDPVLTTSPINVPKTKGDLDDLLLDENGLSVSDTLKVVESFFKKKKEES